MEIKINEMSLDHAAKEAIRLIANNGPNSYGAAIYLHFLRNRLRCWAGYIALLNNGATTRNIRFVLCPGCFVVTETYHDGKTVEYK